MLRWLNDAFLLELKRMYPKKDYGPQDDIGFIMYHEGRQSVVRDLEAMWIKSGGGV